jgi:hypothetical protein
VVLAPDAELVEMPDVDPASPEVTEPLPHAAAVHVRDAATSATAAEFLSTMAIRRPLLIDQIARAPAML